MKTLERCEQILRIGSMYHPGMTVDTLVFLAKCSYGDANGFCRDLVKTGLAECKKLKLPGFRRPRNVYRMLPKGNPSA